MPRRHFMFHSTLIAALGLFLCSGGLHAATLERLYLAADFGWVDADICNADWCLRDSSGAYRLSAGYQLHPRFGIEMHTTTSPNHYREGGRFPDQPTVQGELRQVGLRSMAYIPFHARYSLAMSLGFNRWNAREVDRFDRTRHKITNTSVAAGIGLEININPRMKFRAHSEHTNADYRQLTLGFRARF